MENIEIIEENLEVLKKIVEEIIHRDKKIKVNWEFGLEERYFNQIGYCYYFYIKVDYKQPLYISFSGQQNIIINSNNEIISLNEMIENLKGFCFPFRKFNKKDMKNTRFYPLYKEGK
jgi:hypothetical protein